MRNFHVPLPEIIYNRLHKQAEHNKCAATEIARKAIEAWLKEQEQLDLHQSIAQYAKQKADSKFDLAKDMEEASIEFLLNENKS